jgi:hypothetical protein
MKQIAGSVVLLCLFFILNGCRQPATPDDSDITNERGLISAELFLKNGEETRFWRIREMDGRGTLLIQEGVLGGQTSSHEVFGEDSTHLRSQARELVSARLREGYKLYGPEAYSQLIVQIEAESWGDIGDLDKLVLVEELLNQYMTASGNGSCSGSDVDSRVSFFITAFNPEIAVGTILKMFREEGIEVIPVIALEKGNEIRILYPENFQGDVSLI